MPYRRLPNTDKSRLKAMHLALLKGEVLDMFDLAFSQKLLNELISFVPRFERSIFEYQDGLKRQVNANKGYQEKLKKARLYVSHYLQAVNMAVMRGELRPEDQSFLGLDQGVKAVPALNTEQSVIDWGMKVMEGDRRRMAEGGKSIYTPSMANVRVYFERFKDAHGNQQFLKNNTTRLLDNVSVLRKESDEIILNIWNEVELKFSGIIDLEKRMDACREYGLIYYYRRGEERPVK